MFYFVDELSYGWLVIAILALAISTFDLVSRQIPNYLSIMLLVSCIILSHVEYNLLWIVKNTSLLILFILLYGYSVWGGADVKVALSFLPAITEQYTYLYLLFTGLLGGVLAFVYLILLAANAKKDKHKFALPYCIPICISGVLFSIASL